MDSIQNMQAMFRYASAHQFEEFDALFSELEPSLPFDEFREAYLMRAQIKLYAGDPSFQDDIEKAGHPPGQPRFPPLSTVWALDAPNRFIVFLSLPGALHQFSQSLLRARDLLAGWYGEQAHITVSQLQGEICYFTGNIQQALDFALEYPPKKRQTKVDVMLSLILQFRCYFALGEPKEAERCMLEIIQHANANPECAASYKAFRDWVIITTNWNGDTPRFCSDRTGVRIPVLKDRLRDIQSGSPLANPLEEPFVEYAGRHYKMSCQMRKVYMDVFHAIYWQTEGDRERTAPPFVELYRISDDCGIIMPLVECGAQVLPLLEYELGNAREYAAWIRRMMAMAEEYEACINKYQTILE